MFHFVSTAKARRTALFLAGSTLATLLSTGIAPAQNNFLDDGGVEDQILVAVRRNTPVEPPLEHREGLVEGQRRKRQITIDEKMGLRLQPPADIAGPAHSYVEIGKGLAFLGWIFRVLQRNPADDGRQTRLDAGDDGTGPQQEAGAGQLVFEFAV